MVTSQPYQTDPEKEFLTKSVSKPNGCATAMPTALELIWKVISLYLYSSVWNNLFLTASNFSYFQKFSQEPHPRAIINIFSIYFDIMRKSEIFRADFSRPDVQPTGWMSRIFRENFVQASRLRLSRSLKMNNRDHYFNCSTMHEKIHSEMKWSLTTGFECMFCTKIEKKLSMQ